MDHFPASSPASEHSRLKVLLIAYACEPGKGSEPGTGWNMALELSEYHDVTVATRANNRAPIEKNLSTRQGNRPEFLYVDPPAWALRLKSAQIMPIQLFYLFWQIALAARLRENGGAYDILHQLTFNSFEIPPVAFLHKKGIKIWGPVGGGQRVPLPLLRAFGTIGGVKEGLRNLRVAISACTPWVSRVLRECSLVLFANHETRLLLEPSCGNPTGMMIDVGVDVARFHPPSRPERGSITLLSAGRLEHRKGLGLLIAAFARLAPEYPGARLRIVGTGPLHDSLQRDISSRKLDDRILLTGAVSHDRMTEEFGQADVFLFPSLRDTSGAVVLEAMSMGLPVACFDHQGAALMVGDGCGIRVTAKTRDQAVEALTKAIRRLISDKTLRDECGERGRQAVTTNHDWKVKAARFNLYYQSLAGNSTAGMHATSDNP